MNQRTMHNCIATLLKHENTYRILGDKGLDRIAFHQGFDPIEFRAAFLNAETAKSLKPSNDGEEWSGK